MGLTGEKRFDNVIEYKAALKSAKFHATKKLAVAKAKERALGLVCERQKKLDIRMTEARKEFEVACQENISARSEIDRINEVWHDSI